MLQTKSIINLLSQEPNVIKSKLQEKNTIITNSTMDIQGKSRTDVIISSPRPPSGDNTSPSKELNSTTFFTKSGKLDGSEE